MIHCGSYRPVGNVFGGVYGLGIIGSVWPVRDINPCAWFVGGLDM